MSCDSPCGGTSKAATVAVTTCGVSQQIIIFFQISSETTHVVTATKAAFDIPPQGLSRNVKYGSSFTEAWFIYLVRARNIALIGLSMVRALGP
jgi:hypothetical protein